MDARTDLGSLLMRMKPAIENRGHRADHEDLFGEVGLAWAERLQNGLVELANAEQVTWGIVRNLLSAFHRREGYRRHLPLRDEAFPSRDPDGLTVLLENERGQAVADAINGLPNTDREILIHRHNRGITSALLARSNGTCSSTERSRYRRAVQRVRQDPRIAALLAD